ncbi:hypothetical protein B0T21DRAFT_436576 [Apiosordaria backusii]|uniref:Uncharacterized protein n=1 Tax=Apiosordaria backusii TaxID=314023 RepID=A0AA40BSF6_9PEZI|nr:hypothetical protein B0T21DRAFT_436576 [Apiosordaria backusii]
MALHHHVLVGWLFCSAMFQPAPHFPRPLFSDACLKDNNRPDAARQQSRLLLADSFRAVVCRPHWSAHSRGPNAGHCGYGTLSAMLVEVENQLGQTHASVVADNHPKYQNAVGPGKRHATSCVPGAGRNNVLALTSQYIDLVYYAARYPEDQRR